MLKKARILPFSELRCCDIQKFIEFSNQFDAAGMLSLLLVRQLFD
jgi:hypothetical protein